MEKRSKEKWVDFINHFEVYIGTVLLFLMMVFLFAQVVSRYVFRHAVVWTEELSNILFVWVSYLGISGAVLGRKHLRIDALVDSLPFRVKKGLLLFGSLLTSLVCFYLAVPTAKNMLNLTAMGSTTMLLGIPAWASYGILPVCLVLTGVRFIQETARLSREGPARMGSTSTILDFLDGEGEEDE